MRRPSVKGQGTLAVTSVSAVKVAENPSRQALVIGIPSADITIRLRTAAVYGVAPAEDVPVAASTDFVIKATRTQEFRLDGYTGPVAMWTAATANVPFIEV